MAAAGWLTPLAFSHAQLGHGIQRVPPPTSGVRDQGAEQFVQSNAARLIAILADRGLNEPQRAEAFHAAFEKFVDFGPFAEIALGRYASTITPDQRARLMAALQAYGQRLSRRWAQNYRGETLQVTGSSVEKPGEVIVNSELAGSHFSRPTVLAWRLQGSDASWKVVDVQYNGAWLGTLRENDYFSTLEQANGDIDVLIARLNKLPRR